MRTYENMEHVQEHTHGSRRFRIVQLTDTHVLQDGAWHHGYDTQLACQRVLDRLDALPDVDVVVVSGDVSEDGSADSYRRAFRMITAWADARHARAIWAMGNHDDREAFREQFVAQGMQPDVLGASSDISETTARGSWGESAGVLESSEESARSAHRRVVAPPIYGLTDLRGVRIITLDTSVPGKGFGMLDAAQLHWLEEVLSVPANGPFGSVIVMHHPPITAATTLMRALALVNTAEFTAAVAGSDVHVVLCGHNHMAQFGVLPGTSIPVCIGAPVTAQADLFGPNEEERAETGSGATVIDLVADEVGATETSCFPIMAPDAHDGVPLFTLDSRDVARIAETSRRAESPTQL